MENNKRPKRQVARNKIYTEDNVLKCNPALFVGYVEELETTEMIMKKFEALEEYQAEQEELKKQNEDQQIIGDGKKKKKNLNSEEEKELSEDELQEIFRRTSAFSAASTIIPPDPGQLTLIPGEDENDEPEYYLFDDGWDMTGVVAQDENGEGEAYYICGGDSDYEDEDDVVWGDLPKKDGSNNNQRKRSKSNKDSSSPSGIGLNINRARQALKRVRRRKPTDPNAIAFVRIPNDPIPSSWAKKINQYVAPSFKHAHTSWTSDDVLMPKSVIFSETPGPYCKHAIESNMETLKLRLLALAKECEGFNGVVLNPPWKEPRPGAEIVPNGIVPEDLEKLPLGSRVFLPAGFLYIWTPKHWLHRTLVVLEKMDLHYVENAVVVNERVGDGPPLSQSCTYFSQQKETLLVCRRGTKHAVSGKLNWEPIELRHQRISDVHLACYRSSNRADIPIKPNYYVHKMAETMLPSSRYNTDLLDVKPRLCEIWPNVETTRAGWTSVSM